MFPDQPRGLTGRPAGGRGFNARDVPGWKRCADACNKLATELAAYGLKFGYQNHGFEFESFDGVQALELLMRYSDPDQLFLELETFWATYAGLDPVALIQKYGARCKCLHLHDLMAKGGLKNAALGTGVLDLEGIVQAGKDCGTE